MRAWPLHPLLASALLLPIGVRAAGVTIITHGWNPSGSAPAWMASLRGDIASHFLGGAQNYGTITVTKPAGSLVATCSPWNVDLSASANGEILILLDWSSVANHLTGGPSAQAVAAAVLDKLVTGQNGQRSLAELPIHLIGHSRGGGMVCELARLLGERGIVVDQLTPLDPHPLTASDPQPIFPLSAVIDTPSAIYQNVVFADVYSQTGEYPTGQSLAGGYNRQWSALPGGYYHNSAPNNAYAAHRNILLLYQGTVNLANPVNNGEATMGATERAAWFNTYENSGDTAAFTYSRLDGTGHWTSTIAPVAGGDAIRAGLHNASVFGGGGSRSTLTWSSAVWPNVAQLDLLTNGTPLGSGTCPITVGTTQEVRCAYLDYDSGCTVTLHLDTDRNPYNNNDLAILSTQVVASATGGTFAQFTNHWNTTGLTNGATACVYAQVTDGARTRYFYAAPVLQFIVPPAPLVVITNPPGDVSVPCALTAITLNGTNNAAVTGTQWWTNTLNAAHGAFTAVSPWAVANLPLAVGSNVITLFGTNALGAAASHTVTITRPSAPPPTIAHAGFAADGNSQMIFTGIPGSRYLVQRATSLTPPIAWTTLSNNVDGDPNLVAGSNGLWTHTDLNSTNHPQRFYRSASP